MLLLYGTTPSRIWHALVPYKRSKTTQCQKNDIRYGYNDIRMIEWVWNDAISFKWNWNEDEKNLMGWPWFEIFPRSAPGPSFKLSPKWQYPDPEICFFSFFLIKNEGMSPEWEWKNRGLSKIFLILPSFNHSIVICSIVIASFHTHSVTQMSF